ncbi:MAG: HAD family hydrolase [Bacteroidota bacterium]
MIDLRGKSVILWDFDGVILDSMPVREYGFKKVLEKFPKEDIEKLLEFHRENGGLSRYVKFRYFFEEIRGENLREKDLKLLTDNYSEIMRAHLGSREFLISETIDFIEANQNDYRMHIVSGSDGKELRFLCKRLKINQFFETIEGSPTSKPELVKNILKKNHYSKKETCLIGDSVNDYDAAETNGIDFLAYNNKFLKKKGLTYIKSFR